MSYHCCQPIRMLHQFKKETGKQLRSLAASARCTTYQEFYEALLHVEDSENAPSDNVGDESGSTQQKSTGGNRLLVTGRVNLSNGVATISDNLVKDLPRYEGKSNGNSYFRPQGSSRNPSA